MIDKQLQFIRNFVPENLGVPVPDIQDEDMIIKMSEEDLVKLSVQYLYNRVYNAKESMLCLYDKGYYYDAFLITGHIFETCAIISYIKDNDKQTQIKNSYKYISKSAVGRLLNLLTFDISNLANESIKKAYNDFVSVIRTYGKDIAKSATKHNEAIRDLYNDKMDNRARRKLIKNTYERPDYESYVKMFFSKFYEQIKDEAKSDQDMFINFYNKYCEIKHSNLASPEMNDNYDKDAMINLFITPMFWALGYLDSFPFDKPMLIKSE